MNKNIIGAVLAVVALAGIAGVVLANQSEKNSTPTSTVSTNDSAHEGMNNTDTLNQNSSQSSAGAEDLTGQNEVAIDITNFEFTKKDIRVSKGTTVTWTNRDKDRHNAFSEQDGGPKGELLSQGESYSFTFDTIGTFDYICEPHPYMKGKVTVVE